MSLLNIIQIFYVQSHNPWVDFSNKHVQEFARLNAQRSLSKLM
jgi:hypothetical protein